MPLPGQHISIFLSESTNDKRTGLIRLLKTQGATDDSNASLIFHDVEVLIKDL